MSAYLPATALLTVSPRAGFRPFRHSTPPRVEGTAKAAGEQPAMKRRPYKRSQSARQRILDSLAASPGLSRNELARMTGLSWGAVAHHVPRLVKLGEIHARTIGRRSVYFRRPDQGPLVPFTRLLRREPVVVEIIRWLNDNGAGSVLRISKALGRDRKKVQRHLERLQESGIVVRTAVYRARYELASLPLGVGGLVGRQARD